MTRTLKVFLLVLLFASLIYNFIQRDLMIMIVQLATIIVLITMVVTSRKTMENRKTNPDVEEKSPEEEKMAYIGTVAAGLAHEIRNPLNAIDFNIRMIQEDMESDTWDPDDIADRFNSTYKEIKHLERLVSDFLLYARKTVLQLSMTDLSDILNQVKTLLQEFAVQNNVEIVTEFDPSIPRVEVDPEILKQALINIVKNGIEASKGKSKILMKTDTSKDSHAQIIIRDNGCGISPMEMRKIFHLFYTTRRSGTGLGLAVAKSIIENHNGWIEVESRPQKGSTFTIFIPYKQG